jgi:hypothetical protein
MITVVIDIGSGPREITINPKSFTLGFLEDIEEAEASGKKTPLFKLVGDLCGLTREERRALTPAQFNELTSVATEAIKAAQEAPKSSG